MISELSGYQKAEYYTAKLTELPKKVPCERMPDGPLCGNGDIGITGTADLQDPALDFYFSKNDIWNTYAHGEIPGIRGYGVLRFGCEGIGGAEFSARQFLQDATIRLALSGQKTRVQISCCALRKTNVIVHTVYCEKGTADIKLQFFHTSREKEAQMYVTTDENVITAHKAYLSPEYEWPVSVHSITKVLGKNSTQFTVKEKEKVTVVTVLYTNQDSDWPEVMCENVLAELDEKTLADRKQAHENWWRDFWNQSGVEIPSEPLLERYWYGSQYLMACCCEEGKFPPGIFGNWITTDETPWGGDYHLNYNYEAPWWGVYSSNHVELSEPYDRPLLDYMPLAKKAAREKLGCRGLYMLVGIGPRGLRTAALTDPEGNDDVNYWGQKSNALYSTVNMIMRFYSTFDEAYARKIVYPYLSEAVLFWLDYLKFEDGRYVIYRDSAHENGSLGFGFIDWVGEDTPDTGDDFNPIVSMGLLRGALRCLMDLCDEFAIRDENREKWEHVLAHLSEFPTMEREGQKIFALTEKGQRWSDSNTLALQHVFPAGCIGLDSEPELLTVARNTFHQMSRWDDNNGFPSFYTMGARLGIDAQELLTHLNEQLREHGEQNYAIDFCHGIEDCSTVPSALNEMLMQSHEGILRLFPVWDLKKDAKFYKLRAYGAFLVSAELKDSEIRELTVFSEKGKDCTIQLPYPAKVTVSCDGQSIPVKKTDQRFSFQTQPDDLYEISVQCEQMEAM